jgi:hypothetical protein
MGYDYRNGDIMGTLGTWNKLRINYDKLHLLRLEWNLAVSSANAALWASQRRLQVQTGTSGNSWDSRLHDFFVQTRKRMDNNGNMF